MIISNCSEPCRKQISAKLRIADIFIFGLLRRGVKTSTESVKGNEIANDFTAVDKTLQKKKLSVSSSKEYFNNFKS